VVSEALKRFSPGSILQVIYPCDVHKARDKLDLRWTDGIIHISPGEFITVIAVTDDGYDQHVLCMLSKEHGIVYTAFDAYTASYLLPIDTDGD
jgi:hypothetical protein